MAASVPLIPTRCAICDTEGNANELYPSTFDTNAFSPEVFSARRLPDHIHYRVVRCRSCGLVRSDPIAEPGLIEKLYNQSFQTYGEELSNIQKTYGRYLRMLHKFGAKGGALLEIGCGSGFFLQEALRQGYSEVSGIEPSLSAVADAIPSLKSKIICDIMKPGLFPPGSFDVICMFQVFDHVPDPNMLLEECKRLLKRDGLVLCLNHNFKAISSQLLKERSPIIDIEHTYLYDRNTISQLFLNHNYQVVKTGTVYNLYTLTYLMQLLPFPTSIKSKVLSFLKSSVVGKIKLSVPLGNLFLVARVSG